MNGEYAVLGLGRFGRSVALGLARKGKAVLAIDNNEELVQKIAPEVDAAVRIDTTDEEALNELQLHKFTCVVVAIGAESPEAAILTTALLRQMGVPRIIARSGNELQSRVLMAVGAHEVVNPDAEMGERLAKKLAHPNIIDEFSFGEDTSVAEVEVPEKFVGKTLAELNLRNRYDISVLAIRRKDKLITNPRPNEHFISEDRIIAMGANAAIQKLSDLA